MVCLGYRKGGFRCGPGTCMHADGSIYNGEWDEDKQNGYGQLAYSNGDVYEG